MITINSKVKNVTGKMFRLVHDGKKVMALIEGTDITRTSTMHEVEEFETEQLALNRIKDLGLEHEIFLHQI